MDSNEPVKGMDQGYNFPPPPPPLPQQYQQPPQQNMQPLQQNQQPPYYQDQQPQQYQEQQSQNMYAPQENQSQGYPPYQQGVPLGVPPTQMQQQQYMQAPIMQPPTGQPIGQNYYPSPPPPPQGGQPVGNYHAPQYQQGVPIQNEVIRVIPAQRNVPYNNVNLNMCDYPTQFKCSFCSKDGITQVQTEIGSGTCLMICCLCFFGGVLGLIPCCVSDCQDKKHFCPYCGAQVGYKPFTPCG